MVLVRVAGAFEADIDSGCGGLKENALQALLEGVALLEEVCHCGGGLFSQASLSVTVS